MKSPFQPVRPVKEAEWLQSAATLLPQMVMMELKKHLEVLWSADVDGDGTSTKLEEALRECALCLLPAMNFDNSQEARRRELLTQSFPTLLPKSLRNLWRQEVIEVVEASAMKYNIAAFIPS